MGIVVSMIALSAFWAGVAAQSSCTTRWSAARHASATLWGILRRPRLHAASQPRCLCMFLDRDAAASLGITINQTFALALPSACQVQTPPVSACKAAAGASSSPPADSPMGSSQATIPSQGRESSDANLTKLTSSSILFLIFFIASYAASLTSFGASYGTIVMLLHLHMLAISEYSQCIN